MILIIDSVGNIYAATSIEWDAEVFEVTEDEHGVQEVTLAE